jgi:hypothetical protein
MSNQRLKLVLLLELLIVVDFPKADQAISVAREHLNNLGAVKTEGCQLRISNYFF